jgi:HEAT repeat protein
MSRWFNSVIVICCSGAIAISMQTSLAVGEEQEVVNMAMDALKSDDPQMRAGAITILREIPGEEVTKSLVAVLPGLPPAGQVQLISALADRGDRTALPTMVESLKASDISVRLSALKAIAQLGDVSSIALLAEMAVRTTGDEQKATRESLYRLRGAEIDGTILQNLDSAEPKIKIELIRAVGERNILSGLQALLKTAKDPDDRVRAESLRSIKYIAPADSLPTLIDLLLNLASESDRDETEKTVAAVAHKIEAGKGQAAAVLAVLPSVSEPARRASLFRVLGRIADDTALPALTAALGSKDSEVQDAAVRALADWPTCQPLTDLLKIAQTSSNEVHKVLALRGFVRMLGLPSDRPSKETIDLYVKAMSLAPSPDEKKRVLSGLANTKLLESMIVAAEYLNDIALYQEAELAVLKIAQGICGSYPEQTKTVLNKVIAAAKQDEILRQSQETIDRIERFGDYVTAWQVSGPYIRQGTDGVAPLTLPSLQNGPAARV